MTYAPRYYRAPTPRYGKTLTPARNTMLWPRVTADKARFLTLDPHLSKSLERHGAAKRGRSKPISCMMPSPSWCCTQQPGSFRRTSGLLHSSKAITPRPPRRTCARTRSSLRLVAAPARSPQSGKLATWENANGTCPATRVAHSKSQTRASLRQQHSPKQQNARLVIGQPSILAVKGLDEAYSPPSSFSTASSKPSMPRSISAR